MSLLSAILQCLHVLPEGTTEFYPMLDLGLPAFVLIKNPPVRDRNTLSPFLLRCGRVSSCLKSTQISNVETEAEVDVSCVYMAKI